VSPLLSFFYLKKGKRTAEIKQKGVFCEIKGAFKISIIPTKTPLTEGKPLNSKYMFMIFLFSFVQKSKIMVFIT